jgi:hypothetical protein
MPGGEFQLPAFCPPAGGKFRAFEVFLVGSIVRGHDYYSLGSSVFLILEEGQSLTQVCELYFKERIKYQLSFQAF